MDSLPNEILQNTFLFLSPRYRYHCALVCKAWYLTYQQPLFYQTITIYKYSQFIKFLTLAKTRYINHKPIGHYVRRLYLKDLYNKHILTYEEIEELHHACPFLTFIDTICMDENDTEQHDLYMIPYWQHLTEIKLWYSRNDTYRLYAAKHGPHLTSLQLDIKDIININELQLKQQQLHINDRYKNKIKIKKEQKDKDKHENDDDEDNKIENNIRIQHDMQPQLQANYQYYYGRVILFPTHHLVHLKELYLCFKSASYRSSVAEYRLDERTLESLHQSCPVLESLSLNYLVLNCLEFLSKFTTTTTTASFSSTSASSTISPCKSLKHLYLKNCKLYRYGNYTYLSKKYPHLISLHLNLQWKDNLLTSSSSSSSSVVSLLIEENDLLLRNRHDNQHHANLNTNAIINSNLLLHMSTNTNNPSSSMYPNDPAYRSMIYEFITGFSYLKELSAEFIYINDFSNVKWQDGLWPGKELLYWLIQHPQQLTLLDYPYDLSTMEYDMKKKKKKKKNSNNVVMKMIKKKENAFKKINEMNGIIRNGNCNHDDNDSDSDDSDEVDSYYANYYEQYDVFQRRAYLDHLTTLVLNTEEEFSYTLHYLLRDGKRKIASNSIINLTIKKEKGIMTHFYLFEWLDAFPRLQSLKLSGVGLIDDKEQNPEQEELMEEDAENQWDHLNYKLKELVISSSSIFLMGGLSMICKVCPSLRVLKLAYVDFFGYLTPLEQTPKQLPYTFLNRIYCIVIDAPHLRLDEFSISSVRCGAYWKQFNEAEMTELLVEEVGDIDNDYNNDSKEKEDGDDYDNGDVVLEEEEEEEEEEKEEEEEEEEEEKDGKVVDEEGKEKEKKEKAKTNGNIFRILEPSKLKPPTNVVLRCKSVDIVNYSNNH